MKIPKLLNMMLALRRPSGGRGVESTLNLIQNTIREAGYTSTRDEHDNIICTTAFTGVLFSSHTDTVHWNEGTNEIRVDDFGIITAWEYYEDCDQNGTQEKLRRTILGADDAAGIYTMLQMIQADIGGTYVFHADEEIGCIGSRALAQGICSIDGWDLEQDFTHAIAFDRKGTTDFIWHQLGQQICSNKCAQSLMKKINKSGRHNYTLAKGIVTDTAMYSDLVPECINLSVGYYDEHTDDERLDLGFLLDLTETIVSNPDMFINLPVAREIEDFDYTDDDDTPWDEPKDYDIVQPNTVAHLCHTYPGEIAQLLENIFNYDHHELKAALIDAGIL